MSIFSKLFSRSQPRPTSSVVQEELAARIQEELVTQVPEELVAQDSASADIVAGSLGLDFDPSRVTQDVRDDLRRNIREIEEFKKVDDLQFEHAYSAALLSISRGGDLKVLYDALKAMDVPGMGIRSADIARTLNNQSMALIRQQENLKNGIKFARWFYLGVPCFRNRQHPSADDISMNEAHQAADGKKYKIAKGLLLQGHYTTPGRIEGCLCTFNIDVEDIGL